MNQGIRDRVFLASAVEGTSGPDELLGRLHARDFDYRRAFLENPLPASVTAGPQAGGSVRVHRVAPERLEVEVDSRGRNLLIFVDNFYPGWQVQVDGIRSELLRVDHTFKGVALGPGKHRVVFIYVPIWGWIGLIISGATFLVVAWKIWPWRAPKLW